jgi:hypothetical protein
MRLISAGSQVRVLSRPPFGGMATTEEDIGPIRPIGPMGERPAKRERLAKGNPEGKPPGGKNTKAKYDRFEFERLEETSGNQTNRRPDMRLLQVL